MGYSLKNVIHVIETRLKTCELNGESLFPISVDAMCVILDLLKEQEPKPVIQDRQCEVAPNVWERKGYCPNCRQEVLWTHNRLHCGFCGQVVKWE